MLVLPAKRFLLEFVGFRRWWWRIGHLSDKVGCTGLRETIDKNPDKRDLDKDVEAQAEPEEYPSTVFEP